MKRQSKRQAGDGDAQPISLKTLAEHLGLSPTTVSLVINKSPAARSIPQETKNRVLEAAERLHYRPNFFARSLAKKRSFTVAVMVPEIAEGYAASVIAGIERRLVHEGYFYFVASHRWLPDLLEETPRLLMQRGVEGFIVVNTPLEHSLPVPVVNVGGRKKLHGVTNITVDNRRAGWLALEHLVKLGHNRIALFKGHAGSADTEERWEGLVSAASSLGIEIDENLVVQLQRRAFPPEAQVPEEGYMYARKLLSRGADFTALFAYNDIAAIGAMRAFRDAGLRVPEDVSVVGFDDIQAAAFMNPQLTTVRQPLQDMGELAAETLLARIASPEEQSEPILVQPELIVRESTCVPAQHLQTSRAKRKRRPH
jgi:LacI family transcriptional regulator